MVDVDIGYNPSVRNTGRTWDLVVGVTVFDSSGTTEIIGLHWFVIHGMPAGSDWSPVFTDYLYTGITGISAGDYIARCRAWKNYNAGTKLGDITDPDENVIGVVYQGGTGDLYGDSPGDGVYLDTIDMLFNVKEAAVAMDISYLDVNVV